MTTSKTPAPRSSGLNQSKPIALRLPDDVLARTHAAARHAGHRPTGFVRHLYQQALASYEAQHGLQSQ